MTTWGRRFAAIGSLLVGALIGSAAVLAAGGSVTSNPTPARTLTPEPSPPPEVNGAEAPERNVMLVWSPGGLAGSRERIARIAGVRQVARVVAGLDHLMGSHLTDGSTVDDPPKGAWIPFETAVIVPREYARFVPPSERDLVLGLRPGEALLSDTSARLRGHGRGLVLGFEGRQAEVTGVISDESAGGYEALVAGPVPKSWRLTYEFLVLSGTPGLEKERIEKALRVSLEPGRVARVRSYGETPFFRYGDAVLPDMIIKDALGEFSVRAPTAGTIAIDPAWRRANITTASVPVLGRITCHRLLIPRVRAALREVVRRGLTHLIDPADYGGCFAGRYISGSPGGRLSHHSWGAAIDINVSANAFGSSASQDPRIVEIFESHGFTWGGRWLIPDGMHFEFSGGPD